MNYYTQQEVSRTAKQIEEIERVPLAERKDAAKEYAADMATNPGLVAQRIEWLLDGNYGHGACIMAWRIMAAKRSNQIAALGMLIAALEWRCPSVMARKAWNGLTKAQQDTLSKAIGQTMVDAQDQADANGCPVTL